MSGKPPLSIDPALDPLSDWADLPLRSPRARALAAQHQLRGHHPKALYRDLTSWLNCPACHQPGSMHDKATLVARIAELRSTTSRRRRYLYVVFSPIDGSCPGWQGFHWYLANRVTTMPESWPRTSTAATTVEQFIAKRPNMEDPPCV